jgi:hypothetical protein
VSHDDPTGLGTRRANVRGTAQGHGAATDPEAVRALQRATDRRREAHGATALRQDPRRPRGYLAADHERAEALRSEAESLRRIAEVKRDDLSRRLVEREAANLEADAEVIVPIRHARVGWR